MDRFNIPLMAEGLTTYAIEWQNGFERSSPPTYAPTWAVPIIASGQTVLSMSSSCC